LAEISDAFQRDPELEQQIDELTSEKRSLITDIREKQNERTRAKELEEETREIIFKALEEFICPVCEERVNRGEADSRLDNQHCPFCDQSTDVKETFRHLEAEKRQSEGQSEEINRELEELRERKDEVDSQIQSLKKERPEIADLNSYAVDQLQDFDHDIDSIHAKAREERAEAEEALEEYSEKLENAEAAIAGLDKKISDLEEKRESKQARIEQLENEDVSTKLSDFEETWNNHYQQITPEIAEDIHLQRNGEIVLVNADGRRREYDRRGDLADAEVVLLNISFVITLNQTALDRGGIDWETSV
jgi:chromosome segregation ATPase